MEAQTLRKVEHLFRLPCRTHGLLHVGSGRPGPLTDAELRMDSRGRIVIPGTAIAGTIRRTVERLASVDKRADGCKLYALAADKAPCGCAVCAFMGSVTPGVGERTSVASNVYFRDAVFGNPKTRVVDSVGIDRGRRAASDARKFDYAQVLPGAAVDIEVRADNLTDQQFEWLGAALRMLASGHVSVGGRTNRGHGFLEPRAADPCKILSRTFSRDGAGTDQLLRAVTHPSDSPETWQEQAGCLEQFPPISTPSLVRLRFGLRIDDRSSLLIADPVAAARSGFDRNMRRLSHLPELPVPSLIGALRSGAERIVRTITAGVALESGTVRDRVCNLFGERCEPPKDAKDDPVAVNEDWWCLVCRIFGNQDWASRLSAVASLDGETFDEVPFDHVAIDRFTGGASEGKKFDALAIRNATFNVSLSLDVDASAHNDRWKIGLLALVLRDLNDGRITLGHGAAKGHGIVSVENLHWQVPRGYELSVEDLPGSIDALWEAIRSPKSRPVPNTGGTGK